jgi:hypothetical protein
MTRRGVMGLFAGAASLALTGCGLFGGSATYRFRMTVEVTTQAGVKTGSSVMEISAQKNVALTSEEGSGFSSGLSRGEAVAVDLEGRPLFVLLTRGGGGNDLGDAVTRALAPDAGKDADWRNYMAAVVKLSRGGGGDYEAELPRAEWPMMVRFRDINDPKSVERVDPAAAGVRRILLETTEDAVTVGIEKRLPSYGTKSGFDAWYATLSMDDPRRFTLDDFRKGI